MRTGPTSSNSSSTISPSYSRMSTWSFLIKEQRSYAGNLGYEDAPEGVYRYDSNVANSHQVREGDLVLVRDADHLLGVSKIERINSSQGQKVILRCPGCSRSNIKARSTKTPLYRCFRCQTEFDQAVPDRVDVTEYEAHYAHGFIPIHGVDRDAIKAAAFRPATQLSIERIDLSGIEARLRAADPRVSALLDLTVQRRSLSDYDSDEDPIGKDVTEQFECSALDTREKILRQIRVRRGREKFRNALLRRHGPTCQMTGCTVVAVLEAAHIWPYRGRTDNDVRNGLLLRADVHALYDLNLIAVHPETLVIYVSPLLREDSTYSGLHQRPLHAPQDVRLARSALERRWAAFDDR